MYHHRSNCHILHTQVVQIPASQSSNQPIQCDLNRLRILYLKKREVKRNRTEETKTAAANQSSHPKELQHKFSAVILTLDSQSILRIFGLTSQQNQKSLNKEQLKARLLKLYQTRVPLEAAEVISLTYLIHEGTVLVTARTEQVVFKSLASEPVKHPIMQQVTEENKLTYDMNFYHSEGEVEVRACGFKNGAMALYQCSNICESSQTAIKYFFPTESARKSSTLEPYVLERSEQLEHRRRKSALPSAADVSQTSPQKETVGDQNQVTSICFVDGNQHANGALMFATAQGQLNFILSVSADLARSTNRVESFKLKDKWRGAVVASKCLLAEVTSSSENETKHLYVFVIMTTLGHIHSI